MSVVKSAAEMKFLSQCARLYATFDIDGNGVLDFAEFAVYVRDIVSDADFRTLPALWKQVRILVC
jgi:hypothetical protein